MNSNEVEIIKEFGGEELYQKYLQYLKDKESLEEKLEKIPENFHNERAIMGLKLNMLEVNFAYNFIFAILLGSNIFDEKQKKNIESFKGDKKFFI